MPYTAAELKRLDIGLCAKCGKYPHLPSRSECGQCTSGRIASRSENLAKGLCANCGKRPPRPSKTECEECALRRAAKLAAKKKSKSVKSSRSSGDQNACVSCKTAARYKTESRCKQCFMKAGWERYQTQIQAIRQGNKCAACQEPLNPNLVELDHIKPSSKGGPDGMWNREVLCIECNRAKGNRNDLSKEDVLERVALRRERVSYVRNRIKFEYDI